MTDQKSSAENKNVVKNTDGEQKKEKEYRRKLKVQVLTEIKDVQNQTEYFVYMSSNLSQAFEEFACLENGEEVICRYEGFSTKVNAKMVMYLTNRGTEVSWYYGKYPSGVPVIFSGYAKRNYVFPDRHVASLRDSTIDTSIFKLYLISKIVEHEPKDDHDKLIGDLAFLNMAGLENALKKYKGK